MKKQFALCIDNKGYEASLIPRKFYEMIPDEQAQQDDFVRVIDESGEVIYTVRSTSPVYHPKVFDPWIYSIEVGDPDTGQVQRLTGLVAQPLTSLPDTVSISF